MAEQMRSRGANVVSAMVPPLPAFDEPFDVVVMNNVMEHMDTMTDALETARSVREVLKPDGRFAICSPDYVNWRWHFYNCDFSHNYVTSRRRLEQMLVNAGYETTASCHLSGPLQGLSCFLLTPLVAMMPFGWLNAALPGNRVFYKGYKLQLTFLRRVLIVGYKRA
jgi:SAM-dependent methyltransferase